MLVVALAQLAIGAARDAGGDDGPEGLAPMGPMMVAAGGPLDEIAIQFHRPGAELFLDVYRQLFRAFSESTQVHVLVSDERDENVFEEARRAWLAQDGRGPRVRYVRVGRPITSWARDRLAVLDAVAGGPLTLLAPPAPMVGAEARANDWLVPWALRDHLSEGAQLSVASFRFEGGDLIADDERVYVATPLFERNPDQSPEAILAQLEDALGRPVLRLGRDGHRAPAHHVGMFVTPMGQGVVLHGDVALGLELIGDRETLMVGGAPLPIDRSEEALAPFVEVHRALSAEALRTVALPLLVSTEANAWISYDNVLMERRRDGRLHVYMPTYGLPELDARATETFEALGAVVHGIGVEGLFRLGGTVRCLVAPLRRG